MKELRSKWLFGVHFFWSTLTLVLGLWWGSVILSQSERIGRLETELGREAIGKSFVTKTKNMIVWESTTYLGLILFSTFALARLFMRDQKRVRALQSFYASFTHELKTPLASIRLQTEALAHAKDLAKGPASLVSRLLEDASRLEHQVERSLELARVESGGKLFLEPVSLKSFLNRTLPGLLPEGSEAVQMDGLDGIAETTITADAHALHVILKNVFENGLKYGRASTTEPYRVNLSLTDQDSAKSATLTIQDRGPGTKAPNSSLGVLFSRGESHAISSAGASGTGVGLYLIKVLMQQMGGEANFEALSPGFRVSLTFKKDLHHGR